jgi:predicted amidophosphoribosyltransferase
MRIPIICMICSRESAKNSYEEHQVELQESGLYYLNCPRGHQTVTCLQELKFEVLFDLGANAIVDGYYREAVTSFASSLERFFEFFISVICTHNKIDEKVFDQSWKILGNLSERQLGAFVMAYLLEYKEKPMLLKNSTTKLRNEVVHKGKIPNKLETIAFGNEVLSLIFPLLDRLNQNNPDAVSSEISQHVSDAYKKIEGNSKIQFLTINTIINVRANGNSVRQSLEQVLVKLEYQHKRGLKYL